MWIRHRYPHTCSRLTFRQISFNGSLFRNYFLSHMAGNTVYFQDSTSSEGLGPLPHPGMASTQSRQFNRRQEQIEMWQVKNLCDVLDILNPVEINVDSHLDAYLKTVYFVDKPLKFWEKNRFNSPQLARLAELCPSVPASSGFVERLFSVSGAL